MLSSEWVDRIFTRLTLFYGAPWMRLWDGMPETDVKATWARELAGLHDKPEVLKFALENLPPDRPVNVGQFRELCRRAPEKPGPKLLRPPKVDPQRFRDVFGPLKRQLTRAEKRPMQWAYDLQERERAGEVLSEAQRLAWRDALTEGVTEQEVLSLFRGIDPVTLPPGMRPDSRGEHLEAFP